MLCEKMVLCSSCQFPKPFAGCLKTLAQSCRICRASAKDIWWCWSTSSEIGDFDKQFPWFARL